MSFYRFIVIFDNYLQVVIELFYSPFALNNFIKFKHVTLLFTVTFKSYLQNALKLYEALYVFFEVMHVSFVHCHVQQQLHAVMELLGSFRN